MAGTHSNNILALLLTYRSLHMNSCIQQASKFCQYMASEEDRNWANLIGELVQVRDAQLYLPLSQCEMHTLIENVCIM